MGLGKKCICVRGNREKYIIEGIPLIVHDEKVRISQEQLDRNEWLKKQLKSELLEYIYKLPKEITYIVEGKKIYISHYPMKEDGSFKKHIKIANIEDNKEMFLGIDADIYLYGHTHRNIYNEKDNKIYINPGSVGFPEDTNKACYGILNIKNDKIEYKQCTISYNKQKVINDIKRTAFPGYEKIIELFFESKNNNLT